MGWGHLKIFSPRHRHPVPHITITANAVFYVVKNKLIICFTNPFICFKNI
jgi:hypothetical protein